MKQEIKSFPISLIVAFIIGAWMNDGIDKEFIIVFIIGSLAAFILISIPHIIKSMK